MCLQLSVTSSMLGSLLTDGWPSHTHAITVCVETFGERLFYHLEHTWEVHTFTFQDVLAGYVDLKKSNNPESTLKELLFFK